MLSSTLGSAPRTALVLLLALLAPPPTAARAAADDARSPGEVTPASGEAGPAASDAGPPTSPDAAVVPAQPETHSEAGEDPAQEDLNDPNDPNDPNDSNDEFAEPSDVDLCKLDPAACPRLASPQIACAESASYTPNPGSKSSDRIVLRSQYLELGGEMVFITSDERLDASGEPREAIRFTDVGMLRLRARRSFSDSLELYAASSVLAKQPADWDEATWQGALGGVRWAFAKQFAARLAAAGGPLFEERGYWWQAAPGLQAKASADGLLRFDLGLGGATTVLEARSNRETFWLQELTSHAEAQFGDNNGAFWVRLDYALPVASGPNASSPDPQSGRFLEPQTRLNLQVGGVLSVGRSGWDAFVTYNWLDRGELDAPQTLLPILDEGFDQSQIVLGVQHRFEHDSCRQRVCGRCVDDD
jgi:hypothetical protein